MILDHRLISSCEQAWTQTTLTQHNHPGRRGTQRVSSALTNLILSVALDVWWSFHSGRLPDIPFDAVCASAILHRLATEELKDMLKGLGRHVFPGGVKTTLEKEQDRAQRREAREECRDRHGHFWHVLDYAVYFDVSRSGESQVEGS